MNGQANSSGEGLSGAAIAGVVVGCIVFISVILAIGYFSGRRRRVKPSGQEHQAEHEHKESELPNNPQKLKNLLEMAAVDEKAVRSDLPGIIPDPVELLVTYSPSNNVKSK